MAAQEPSIGRVVHFRYGDLHYAAMITDIACPFQDDDGAAIVGQALIVHPPLSESFTTVAVQGDTPGTWHWPEDVPAKAAAAA